MVAVQVSNPQSPETWWNLYCGGLREISDPVRPEFSISSLTSSVSSCLAPPPSLARMASSLYTENPQTSWLSLQLRTFILPPLTSAEMSTVLWSIIGLLNRILLIKSSVMCRSHIFMCPVSSRYLFLCFPIFFSHFPLELSYLRVCYVTIGHFHFDQTSGHMLLQW